MSNNKLKILSLCDGIATGKEVFRLLGVDVEYHSIEIEDYKRKIADANHRDIVRPSNDVTDFADNMEFEHYDLILCGFTCTSLSSQGPRTGWDGASRIFFDCLKIVEECKKVNPKLLFFFENVASMKEVFKNEISELLGVKAFLGKAGLVSAQDRNRLYWFNWEDPEITPIDVNPSTLLDEDGLLMFSVSKSNRNKKGEKAIVEGRFKASGKAGTLVTGRGCRGQSTANMVVTKKLVVRDLTTSECARIQGLGDYKWPCSDSQIFTSIGEGWSVEMVKQILQTAPIIKELI